MAITVPVVDIPANITNVQDDDHDCVTYEADGKRITNVCYQAHMLNLPRVNFVCYPYDGTCSGYTKSYDPNKYNKSILPAEIYLRWMQLCKDNGLIPETAEAFIENGKNCFRLPCAGNNRHEMYAALCCYRWSDNLAKLPYHAVHLVEKLPKLNFYQILHYVMQTYVYWLGHSFCNVSKTNNVYNASMGLAETLAASYAFGKSTKLVKSFRCVPTEITYTCSELKKIGSALPSIKLPAAGDHLWEGWTEIYDKDKGNARVNELYSEFTRLK